MDPILSVATILGGVAAVWFLVDKTKVWRAQRRPAVLPSPTKIEAGAGGPASLIAQDLQDRVPDYMLVRPAQQTSLDLSTSQALEPWYAAGDFFGDGTRAIALLAQDRSTGRFAALVVGKPNGVDHRIFLLDDQLRSIENLYLRTVSPGLYRISRAVWKRGGPTRLYLKHEGVELGTYESAARIFYWNGQDFIEQWMTD